MKFSSDFYSPVGRDKTQAFVASTAGMLLFKGYGPIPGIRSVEVLSEGNLIVFDSSGGQHFEKVLRSEEGFLQLRVLPSFPENLLVREMEENWFFFKNGLVQRRFVLFPEKYRSPLLLLFLPFLKKAIEQNNARIIDALRNEASPGQALLQDT